MKSVPLTLTHEELSIVGTVPPLPRAWGMIDLEDGRVILGTSGEWKPGEIVECVLHAIEHGVMDWDSPCKPFANKYPNIDAKKLRAALVKLPKDFAGGEVYLEPPAVLMARRDMTEMDQKIVRGFVLSAEELVHYYMCKAVVERAEIAANAESIKFVDISKGAESVRYL